MDFFCHWKSLTLEGVTCFGWLLPKSVTCAAQFLMCKGWLQMFSNKVNFWMLLLQFSFAVQYLKALARLLQHMNMDFFFFFCVWIVAIFSLALHYNAKSYLGSFLTWHWFVTIICQCHWFWPRTGNSYRILIAFLTKGSRCLSWESEYQVAWSDTRWAVIWPWKGGY